MFRVVNLTETDRSFNIRKYSVFFCHEERKSLFKTNDSN